MARTRPAEETAARFLPSKLKPESLRLAAAQCTACHLHERATQTVFGRGPSGARLMLVGEQPGDQEDIAGQAFVGPAGRVLASALEAARIDPTSVYVTNAVKHFKWRPVGKRRLHESPNRDEVEICKPWLLAELQVVAPRCVVALGATAGMALLGKRVVIGRERGQLATLPQGCIFVQTYHPSSVLRQEEGAEERLAQIVEDLRLAASTLGEQQHLSP